MESGKKRKVHRHADDQFYLRNGYLKTGLTSVVFGADDRILEVPVGAPHEIALTHKVAEIINAQIAVSCTGCSYCTDGCPMSIPIPKYFSLYNEDMREDLKEKGWTINFTNYENLTECFGKASDCVACGQCEGVCPQHLPIIELMKKVSAHFEH